MLFALSSVYAQEEQEKEETLTEDVATQDEAVKENAEEAQKELKEETEPAPAEKSDPVFFEEQQKDHSEKKHVPEFKPIKKEIRKKWHFIPLNISIGTSIQIGFTVAQLTHKNFEIRLGTLMLGPGFTFGSSGKDDEGFVPGLALLVEIGLGKFFGNPLKESCFGIILGVGSKIIFDIRKDRRNDSREDEWSLFDTLYSDFLPIYLTYRWKRNDKFYDISLRIPLVWQNGIYRLNNKTTLYNGVPDISLNFSFVF